MPATSGTDARNGPENRPMKMPSAPQFLMNSSPIGIICGYFDSGQMCWTRRSSFSPIQYDNQSPSAAPTAPATQIGQKLNPPAWTSPPIRTRAPQAGTSSEMKASDSANASANTIGAAQAWCSRTKSTIGRTYSSNIREKPLMEFEL